MLVLKTNHENQKIPVPCTLGDGDSNLSAFKKCSPGVQKKKKKRENKKDHLSG